MYHPARPGDELAAAQLLDVTNEAELEGFLGRLVDSAVRRAGGRVPAATRRALMAVLRRTAERALPTLTTALGEPLRPPAGVGPSVAETAARVYGLELEGMSVEDRDYEIARQFLASPRRWRRGRPGRRPPASTRPSPTPAGSSPQDCCRLNPRCLSGRGRPVCDQATAAPVGEGARCLRRARRQRSTRTAWGSTRRPATARGSTSRPGTARGSTSRPGTALASTSRAATAPEGMKVGMAPASTRRPGMGLASTRRPGMGLGEYEAAGYGSGEYEQPGYGSGEYEQPGYGSGEYEQPGYGSGEYEQPGYGSRRVRAARLWVWRVRAARLWAWRVRAARLWAWRVRGRRGGRERGGSAPHR